MSEPRVDTEGDGELRERIVEVSERFFGDSTTDGENEAFADVLMRTVFGDVERELADLREAAAALTSGWDAYDDRGADARVYVPVSLLIALRDVLASAVQSEDPKQ